MASSTAWNYFFNPGAANTSAHRSNRAVILAVEDLGLANRTLIIFTGDNGSSTGGERGGRKLPPGKGLTSRIS